MCGRWGWGLMDASPTRRQAVGLTGASPVPWARQRGAWGSSGCEQPSVSRLLLRDCVHTLHSRDTWLKQARVVRLGEVPYKVRAVGRKAAARPGGRGKSTGTLSVCTEDFVRGGHTGELGGKAAL